MSLSPVGAMFSVIACVPLLFHAPILPVILLFLMLLGYSIHPAPT